MPDHRGYQDLARLLASPASWTEAEAQVMLSMRRNQTAIIAEWHAKNIKRVASMKALLADIDVAIGQWQHAKCRCISG